MKKFAPIKIASDDQQSGGHGETLVTNAARDLVRADESWRQVQDAFMVRARDAVERGIREKGGITPEELLKRIDARLSAALLGR